MRFCCYLLHLGALGPSWMELKIDSETRLKKKQPIFGSRKPWMDSTSQKGSKIDSKMDHQNLVAFVFFERLGPRTAQGGPSRLQSLPQSAFGMHFDWFLIGKCVETHCPEDACILRFISVGAFSLQERMTHNQPWISTANYMSLYLNTNRSFWSEIES